MKKTTVAAVAFILAFSVLTPQAYAGHGSHARWEGVAIGLTAGILGAALIHKNHHQPGGARMQSSVTVYRKYPSRHHRSYRRHHHRSGHWEIRKVWIAPEYRKVWNPGHYNRRGHWKQGTWIRIEIRPGYWGKERVWVPHR